jgi:hypothetical protein
VQISTSSWNAQAKHAVICLQAPRLFSVGVQCLWWQRQPLQERRRPLNRQSVVVIDEMQIPAQ